MAGHAPVCFINSDGSLEHAGRGYNVIYIYVLVIELELRSRVVTITSVCLTKIYHQERKIVSSCLIQARQEQF